MASMTESELRATASLRRRAALSRTNRATPEEISLLQEASNSEVAENFIEGPYTETQVTQIFGHSDWGVIPRFVLEQGLEKKVRPIDDGHASQVNEAFTSLIKLELQGADFVSGLALLIARAEKERSDRLGVPARQWLGRTLDLSKAYKQLAVLPLHRDIAVICHPNEKGEPQFFVANALMFGLTSSVYGFVRVARSLHFLLCKVLKIPSANYFDDYPLFALREGAQELDGLTSEFLELLGWRFAQTGIKGQPYEETFTVLGMQLDVSRLHEGVAVLANKEGRVKRIAEMLGNIFDRGTLGRHEAQVLLGLLNYASGFFAGRSLKPACHFLLSLVRGKRPTAAEIQRFCKTTQAVLSTTPPRILRIFDPRPPIHVWTDGAWEDPWLLERWKLDVGSQLMCEIELYALITLRRMLQNSLCNRRVIFWLDNEAARTSAIKGLSKSESMYRLAHYLAVIEAEVMGKAYSAWILQTQERQAMLRAVSAAYGKLNEAETPSAEYLALKAEETEQNEPTAAQLDTITSKRDSQTATIQSSVDPAGHLRITKTKQKVEMPQNSEAYRRVLKIEGLTMADFTKFVDYILGERVAGLRLEQATGYDSSHNALFRPPWGIVLRYEYKLRKEAFRLVNDEGQTLQDALAAVTKDSELKEVHFAYLALQSGVSECRGYEFHDPDLMTDRFWDSILQCLCQGDWIFLASPPLETMSRARHKRPGPAPLRSEAWPTGFPWLSDDNRIKVEKANSLFQRCVEAASACASAGGCFVLESPEDLGATKDGERPASFWQLPQVRDLQVQHNATTWAYFRCAFGAPTAKPSRFLCNSERLKHQLPPYSIWPTFDAEGRYVGPLPPRCPHSHHPKPLVGRQGRDWNTATSVEWPAALCDHVLHSILPSVLRARGDAGRNAGPPEGRRSSTAGSPLSSISVSPAASGLGPQADRGVGPQVGAGPDSSEAHAHNAEALACEILSKDEAPRAEDMIRLYEALPKEVSARDPEGRIPSSFSTGAYNKGGLTGLRKACHDFPLATKCLVRFVRSMRPFHPFSTISIYDNVCTPLHKDSRNACCENLIIPLTQFWGGELWMQQDQGSTPQNFGGSEVFGTAVPIPPEGLCFDARGILHCTMPWKGRRLIAVAFTVSKTEELKQSDAQLLEDLGINCPSASQSTGRTLDAGELSSTESSESEPPSGGLDQQADDVFRPELCGNFGNPLMLEWDGRESPITDGYGLCSPTRWHPASRGASLPEQSKDLSRRLNGLVQQFVAEQVPDCQLLALKLATGQILESPFDEGAMRRLREDWAALVCETDGAKHEGLLEVPDPQPFYLRLLSHTSRLLEDPDWKILTEGEECFEKGVPLGYDETIPRVPQVFDRKVKWRKLDESTFEAVKENYQSAKLTVQEMELKFREEEKLGRMYPTTYSALAAEHGADRVRIAAMGAVAKPDGSVRPLHDGTHGVKINNGIRLLNQTATPGPAEVAGFRTDAKCADGCVVLAGWELSDDTKTSKWFSLRLTPSDAPYLFDQEGKSQWASGSAELLATLAALHIFGYLTASVDRKELDVECAADTDNQSNSRLLKKGSSTKWPLMLINMQLSDLLLRSSLKLLLRWRPRDENQYADQLTNEIFTNFSDEHRIACTYSDLPLSLLHQLWETKESFDSARRAQAVLQQDASGHRPQKRKAEKTPW
ncbi:unnamed protein product [Symbiodinium sp. CCMP2592]|nr:unnamed protein product [Symbiodinium sp. CCMP2592]